MPHLLVLDDHLPVTLSLSYVAQHLGWKASAATDPEEALALLIHGDVDVLLIDYQMPRRNGLEVVREMRQRQLQTPVIMMTACPGEIDRQTAHRLRVLEIIVKPFDVSCLTQALNEALRQPVVVPPNS